MTSPVSDPAPTSPTARVADEPALARVDTTVPHPARRYDYWLGGKDNFAADRASGDAIAAAYPPVRLAALANREFMHRMTRFLVAEAGIRQILDIGTGIPTSPNLHEIAQSIAPESRVVYVDNDPIVLTHARALLTSTPEGATVYVDADLRRPDEILRHPSIRATLDFSRPVGLSLVAVMHFVADSDDPLGIIAKLVGALPSGSYLAISHATTDLVPPDIAATAAPVTRASGIPVRFRTKDEVGELFQGLDLVPPGVAPVTEWRPVDAPEQRTPPAHAPVYGAVGRKP